VVLLIVVVVVIVEVVDDAPLLWPNKLLLLARVTSGCQLPYCQMTSSAFASGAVRMNHLQFRSRRV
jgi:hypothetical protein